MKATIFQGHAGSGNPIVVGYDTGISRGRQWTRSVRTSAQLLLFLVGGVLSLETNVLAGLLAVPQRDFRRQTWTISESLPSNSIQAILQTRDGFLWLATPRGLVRFDGLHFEVFNRLNMPGMTSDDCRALAQTTDDSLWVATRAGLLRFQDGQCQRLGAKDGLSAEEVQLLHASDSGTLWIGTLRGLHRWQEGVLTAFTTREGLADDWIGGMDEDGNGDLWVVTRRAVHRFDKTTQRWVQTWQRSGRPAELPSAIHVDSDGLWFLEGTLAVAGSLDDWCSGAPTAEPAAHTSSLSPTAGSRRPAGSVAAGPSRQSLVLCGAKWSVCVPRRTVHTLQHHEWPAGQLGIVSVRGSGRQSVDRDGIWRFAAMATATGEDDWPAGWTAA